MPLQSVVTDLALYSFGMLRFKWDPVKAQTSQRKHGVSFEDANDVVRLISARQATRRERKRYEQTRI